MPHTIIGTAGHIDHGKTSLVRALTGIDTDTLPEEKAREITIDLGFAYWREGVTVIDVPGHERFIRNMVAGVSAIDLALFVIAADDGPMPQTREHLDILDLLQVRRGVIAVTKIDLVERDWLDLVLEDVRTLVRGTFLEEAPIVPVSSATGQGLPDLERHLAEAIARTGVKPDRGVFRLPIDRVFSARGFGTVVTGTVLSGRLRPGDEVDLLPAGRRLRVRGIQRHGRDVEAVAIGERAAVNLAGVEKEEVSRGDGLAEPEQFRPTMQIDARLRLLPASSKPLKTRARLRLHVGTAEVMARAVLLEAETLSPGASGLAQFRLEAPAVVAPGDRFVVRRYSPPVTLGGGVVLDAQPPRRRSGATLTALMALESDDPDQIVEARLRLSGTVPKSARMLSAEAGVDRAQITEALNRLTAAQRAVRLDPEDGLFVHAETWETVRARIAEALSQFHAQNPLREGLNRDELRQAIGRTRSGASSRAGDIDAGLFEAALASLITEEKVRASGPILSLSGHRITLSPAQERLRAEARNLLATGGATPPGAEEIARALSARPAEVRAVIEAMQGLGEVVRADADIVFHRPAFEEIQAQLIAYLREHGEITVADFRTLVGTTRKYALPLMNAFDDAGVTLRRGDVRILAQ
ncbi:MAG: selenocysteine-specific translation elongation factor [Candidatus Latescibacteria bacterium]|nr:selenocysteine-specific translation elongation factor [Candidatus Latescibacterota bacterium]